MDSGRRLAGPKFCGQPYFAGEVEPRINGQVAASGAYFGQDGQRIVDRLLGEQLVDDGWNCEVENGSTRAPFDTTLCVLEALIEYELAGASCDPVRIGAVTVEHAACAAGVEVVGRRGLR